jgi:cytochrome c oxidase subunit 4
MSTHHAHVTDEKAEARSYLLTLLALLFLTVITVGASYIDFGQGNVVIALAIATMKATLVALFFMHLAHDKPVNGLIAVAGFIFLGLFLMFDLLDITTRRDAIPQNLHAPVVQTATPAGAPAVPTAAPAAAPPAGTAPAPGAKKE